MKLFSIGAFFLILASASALVSGAQARSLVGQTWLSASEVLPAKTMSTLGSRVPTYVDRLWRWLPQPMRQKLPNNFHYAIELMIWRLLMMGYLTPGFAIALLVGLLEGFWSRSTQTGLVQIHSPMRFNFGLIGLAAATAITMLWVTAPISVPILWVVLCVIGLAVISIRTVVIHAPSPW